LQQIVGVGRPLDQYRGGIETIQCGNETCSRTRPMVADAEEVSQILRLPGTPPPIHDAA